MKRNFRRKWIIFAAALAIIAVALVGRQWYIHSSSFGLPYAAQFMPNVDDPWTALGGTWEMADGSMRNDSNDRGAKLLTGSPNWTDYIVEADFQQLGVGSVGVLARVSEPEVGENSFKGYFAGIRDNSLVLGSFDFAYHEAAKVPLPGPPNHSGWYHIKLKVEGCQISASAWGGGRSEVRSASLNDPDCFQSGNIGLRSNGSGGVWRNVTVVPVHSAAAATSKIAQNLPLPDASVFKNGLTQTGIAVSGTQGPGEDAPSTPVQSISSLSNLAPFGSPVASVHGSVVLTRPAIYVQDSSGGLEIQLETTTRLAIGDEVEATGEVSLDGFGPMLRRARLRILRQSVPISPAVLTANQVASGSFDGRFVQIEGYLRTISTDTDGGLVMNLDAGSQSFHAVLPAGRSRSHLQHLAPESRLRLRGVSVTAPRFNKASDPFVILVRSAEDVEVVAGPRWWRPSTLIFASLVVLGLIFAANHVYLLAKHWRLRAIADERERLAHEIHDTLAQSFAGIGFQLQAIRNSVPRGATALEGQVNLAMLMARTSHEEARRSIASLRPGVLGNTGLLPALRECAERMVKNGNVTVETYGEDGGRAVSPRVKDTLYRIGQEAIANSIRHADPCTIRIRLQRTREAICLSVEDDGEGFIPGSDRAGFGLLGMRKRAESISAALVIKSVPGSGTQVEVRAPAGSRFLGIV